MTKKLILLLVGFLPFLAGEATYLSMMEIAQRGMPNMLVYGLIFLPLWALVGFVVAKLGGSRVKSMLWLHIPAAVDLALVALQEVVLEAYWMNFIGRGTQYFFLPQLNLASKFTSWSGNTMLAYCMAFVLMIAAAAIGMRLRPMKKK